MFIRPCYRKIKGKRQAYWTLVESYRTERGPRQRTVAWLGKLKDSQRAGVKQAAEGGKKSRYAQLQLFDHDDNSEPEWVEIDAAKVRIENQLEFGGAWLALELMHRLRLDEFFENVLPRGKEDIPWGKIVTTMERRYGRANRIWCGDRGMMSKANLEFMESGNRRYIIGASKGTLKKFERELLGEDWRTIREGLEVKLCSSPDGGKEMYILCRSRDRREKEKAIYRRRGGVPDPQERPANPAGLAPDPGAGPGPHSGLLLGVRPLEDTAPDDPSGRLGRRAASDIRGIGQDKPRRCRSAYPAKKRRNPPPLRGASDRSPSHLAGPPRAAPAASIKS